MGAIIRLKMAIQKKDRGRRGEAMTIPWIIVFIYSWIIFLIFVDRSRLKKTIYGGVIAVLLGSLVDWAGHRMDLYQFDHLSWYLVSIFYAAGPLFTAGVLFFQYISRNRLLQAANIVAFTLSYLAVEILLVSSEGARYLHWHYLASLGIDLITFTAFSYIGECIVLDKTGAKNRNK